MKGSSEVKCRTYGKLQPVVCDGNRAKRCMVSIVLRGRKGSLGASLRGWEKAKIACLCASTFANRKKLTFSRDFWKIRSVKSARPCGEKHFWKTKSQKTDGRATFLSKMHAAFARCGEKHICLSKSQISFGGMPRKDLDPLPVANDHRNTGLKEPGQLGGTPTTPQVRRCLFRSTGRKMSAQDSEPCVANVVPTLLRYNC